MVQTSGIHCETILFDLDGTLLDTLTDLANSCNHALREYGLPERTVDDIRLFLGNGVRRLIGQAVPQGEANPFYEDVLKSFREYYLEHQLDKTRPYPGILELLGELRRRGVRVAVVSNKFNDATCALCKHFFKGLVDVAIGEREGIRKKPAPDLVNEALRQLGAKRETAVYVGDSDVDIQTARNAGIPCISVLWGFRNRDFLISHGATTLVENPMEMLKVYDNVCWSK